MRTTATMVVLALLAGATWLASWQRDEATAPPQSDENAPPLGYYVRGARWLGTDDEGRVAYQIFAERLDELPDEQRLRLAGVSVRYRPVEEAAWDIAATNATAPKDGSVLELVGDVRLTNSPADGSRPMSIATAKLKFSPGTSRADSDDPVHLSIGDLELDGGCLRAQLKDETLRLECGVHGTFGR